MVSKTITAAGAENGRTTVMSKSGFLPRPKSGSGSNILSILFSIFLILGGLSGRYVLRGTNSSGALVVVGFLFLIWDIVSARSRKAAEEKADAEFAARYSRMRREEKAVGIDERELPGDVSIRISCDKSLAALDVGPRLNGRDMTKNIKDREFTGTTRHVKNIVSFTGLDLTAVFEIPEESGEIVLELFKDKSGIGIAVPGEVTLTAQPEA